MRAPSAGISLGPLDGAIVSIKDLFDVAGEVTRAGSKVLAEEGKPARSRCAGGAAPARRRRGDRRQDQHDRVRLFRHRRQSAFRHAGQSGRPRARARRLVLGRARSRPPTACARSPSAPTPAARPAFRRRSAASSASSRAGSASRPTARSRCPTARLDRPDGEHGRRLRQGRRGDGGRRARRRSSRRRSPACASASRRACCWRISTTRSANAFPRAHRPRWKKPACGCPTRSCRCSTTWRGSTQGRRAAGGGLRHPPRPARPPRRRHRPERARAAGARAQHRRRRLYRPWCASAPR